MTSRLAAPALRFDRRRAARRVAVGLLGLSAALATVTAQGEPTPGFTLHWQAPSGCPQQAEVMARIRALIGATRTTGNSLRADGTITQIDGSHFHLRLLTRSGALVGERELDASSCENLTGAAAVSLALLMRSAEPLSEGDLAGKSADAATTPNNLGASGDAQASGTSATGSSARTNGSASTASNSASASATAATAARKPSSAEPKSDADDSDLPPSEIIQRPIRPSPRTWRALAQLPLAQISIGPLPRPSFGVGLAGGASFSRWRLLLGGSAWLRQNLQSEEAPDVGAEIDRLTGTFRACHALMESRFEVAPCFALSLEHISARGTGAGVRAHAQQTTWLALGAGAHGRLKLTDFLAIFVGLDAQIETARPVISVAGVGEIHQLGMAAFNTTVGPEWIF